VSPRPGITPVRSSHHISKSFFAAAPLALILTVASAARAAWPPDGAPVTTAPGEQYLQSTVPDGDGGVYVFWRDNRLGYDYAPRYDIYGQHLDSHGNTVAGWDSLGNPIANTDAFEVDALSVGDGAGGAVVMWSTGDYRLQHVHANGAQTWGSNGVAVAESVAYRVSGHLMSDGAGGVYVVWANATLVSRQALCPHCEPTYTYHLFAQRIDASGNRQWGSMGVPVTTDSIGATVMLLEGNGGAPLILWSDALGTIRAQELDPDGHPRLTPEGQAIPNLRLGITAVTGPRQAVTAYTYGSDTNEDIGAQRLGSNLTVDWGDAGEPIITAPHKQEATGIASDGAGGVLLAWHDVRNAVDWDVYVTRLTPQGTVAPGWPDQGLPICTLPENQTSPTVICDGAGGAFVAWIDLRNPSNDYDLYLQHVLGNGAIAPGWPDQGLPVCTQPQTQAGPQLVTDGHGGVIVVWNDVRRGAEIYAQQINPDGAIGDELTAVTASLATLRIEANDVVAEWQVDVAGADHVDVVRSSYPSGFERIGQAPIDGSHRARFVDRNVAPGHYGYAIQFTNHDAITTSAFAWIDVVAAARFTLTGFRPNPSDGRAPVAFVLPEASSVRVEVFDVRGRRIRDLSAPRLDAGSHTMEVGSRLPAGVYWIRLRTRGRTVSARGVVLE
jgi:hypothetical protein